MCKSTTGKSIIKLNDITSGEILYEGIDIQRFVNVKICLNLIKDTDDFSRPICVFKS